MDATGHHIWIGFAGGLLGFAHCLGMCGGFALHLSLGKDGARMLAGQLLWLAGKLFSYLFLGATAGYAGSFLETCLLRQGQFQNLLSFAAGGAILLMGLSVLGLLPVRIKAPGGIGENVLVTLCRGLLTGRSPGAALALGLATGFLPCPIVLAFLAYALQSGSVGTGMLTMGALGLGTALPLLLLGGATRLSGIHLRSWAPKAGGIILITLGLATALRGATVFHHLLGCSSELGATDARKPGCTGGVHGRGGAN